MYSKNMNVYNGTQLLDIDTINKKLFWKMTGPETAIYQIHKIFPYALCEYAFVTNTPVTWLVRIL